MSKNTTFYINIIFCLLIIIIALSRLIVALTDYRYLIGNDIYQDDAFYYFKIARNFVNGRGMTFDGITATNGFQPFYFILLIPVMFFTNSDLIAPIHISGIILSIFAVGTGFLLFALLKEFFNNNIAIIGLTFWTINPYFIMFGVNGLETGIAMFFLVLLLFLYLKWFKTQDNIKIKNCILFGIVCGLSIMVRLDMIFLLTALFFDWIIINFHKKILKQRIIGSCIVLMCACFIYFSWLGISRFYTGCFLPLSGKASKQIALNYGWHFLPKLWAETDEIFFDPDNPPISWYANISVKSGFFFLFESPLLYPLRANVKFNIWGGNLGEYILYKRFKENPFAGLILFVLITSLIFVIFLRKKFSIRSSSSDMTFIMVFYLILFFLGYVFYAPSSWFFLRYLTQPVLFFMIYGLSELSDVFSVKDTQKSLFPFICLFWILLCLYCQADNLSIYKNLNSPTALQKGFLKEWQKLSPYIDTSKKIGAFQAGIYSYFSQKDIINLDGKVNPQAYMAIKNKNLHNYIKENKIDYIIDWEWILVSLCLRHVKNDNDLKIEKIVIGKEYSDISIYLIK